MSPLRRAAASVKSSFSEGMKGGFGVTGGSSTMGTVGGSADAAADATSATHTAKGQPDWAKRMQRSQRVTHGVQATAHAVRSGDSHASGSSVNLSERDRS